MKTIGKHAVDCLPGKATLAVAARSRAGILLLTASALSCCALIAGEPDRPSICQPQEPNESPSDLERMQGTWRVTASQVGDEQADPAEMARRRIIIKGDNLIYEYGNPQHEKREGTVSICPRRTTFRT